MEKAQMHRDVRCANDVAEMAKLGRFEKEYIAYGTAVQSLDEKIYYYATADEEKLFHYIDQEKWTGKYFSPIVSSVKRICVPSGMEDEIIQAVKYGLLNEMKREYESVQYFSLMDSFFKLPANDNSYRFLLEYKEQIDGYFDERDMQLFLGVVQIAYEGKVLTEKHYRELMNWYNNVKRQMEDAPVVGDTIERTLYGFVYCKDGICDLAFDAREMCVVHQHYEKIMSGFLVGPIMKKTYWFRQFKDMRNIREHFCNWLKEGQDQAYFELVKKIREVPGVVDRKLFTDIQDILKKSPKAEEAYMYYRQIWNMKS